MGCVYKITNKANGKFYIGSTNNFKRRMLEHFGDLKRNEHYSDEMQKDYNAYGRDSFIVDILEECEDIKSKEQYYIDLLNPVDNGYNASRSAYSNTVPHPMYGEENPFYGKHHTEETKEILRKNGWKLKGKKHKKETIDKMKEKSARGNNANATIILQYDLDMNFIKEWKCIADACSFYGWKSHSHVSNCCERNFLHKREKWCTAKGFIWKYKDEPKRKKVM